MAKLYYRYGAMNSGKTTALLQVAFNYNERGMRVLILKASVDTKGGDHIVSRLGVNHKVDVLVSPDMDILDIVRADTAAHGSAPACVLCDESQFFTPAQAEQLFLVTVDLNIPVICYGLRADFMNRGFPGSLDSIQYMARHRLRRVLMKNCGSWNRNCWEMYAAIRSGIKKMLISMC